MVLMQVLHGEACNELSPSVTYMILPLAFTFLPLFLFFSSLNFQLVQLTQPLYFFTFSFVFLLDQVCLMLVLLYSETEKEGNRRPWDFMT